MSSVGIDKRSLRKIIRTYLKRGPVPERKMVDYLIQRYKLDDASVKRAIKSQLRSRRIERVPGVGLRLMRRRPAKRHRKSERRAKLVDWHYEKGDRARLTTLGEKWFTAAGLRVLTEQPDWRRKELGKDLKGVYALYKKAGKIRTIYYVGRAQHLPTRLKAHLTDRLKGKWNEFSMYGTKDKPTAATLETVLIRIAKPEGNKQHQESVPLGLSLRSVISNYHKSEARRA